MGGWVCRACNTGVGMADDIEHLEKRIAFLKAHEKKWNVSPSSKRSVKSKKPKCSLCYILCPIAFSTDSCYHNFLDLKFAKRS